MNFSVLFYGPFFCYFFTSLSFFFLQVYFLIVFFFGVRYCCVVDHLCCTLWMSGIRLCGQWFYFIFFSLACLFSFNSFFLSFFIHSYYKWIICSFMTIKLLMRHFIKWIFFSRLVSGIQFTTLLPVELIVWMQYSVRMISFVWQRRRWRQRWRRQ